MDGRIVTDDTPDALPLSLYVTVDGRRLAALLAKGHTLTQQSLASQNVVGVTLTQPAPEVRPKPIHWFGVQR